MVNDTAPAVSVVIPCRNELGRLRHVCEDLDRQDFPETFEVVIADGSSDDGTRELIAGLVADNPFRFRLRLVDNPRRIIPCGLNAAVQAAAGSAIIRVDGHSRLPADYLRLLSQALAAGVGDVVGPRIRTIPGGESLLARTIALALGTRLGSGGTPSRGTLNRPVRTVHTVMSCYYRTTWERIGGYDERLGSNEDFDFDYRAGRAGFRVVSLPAPEFGLVARPTLTGLARQRWRYGWWKAAVLTKQPRSLSARQVLPPLALLAAVAVGTIAPKIMPAGLALYCAITAFSALAAAFRSRWSLTAACGAAALAPAVFGVVQGIWAAGLLAGLAGNRYPSPPHPAGAP